MSCTTPRKVDIYDRIFSIFIKKIGPEKIKVWYSKMTGKAYTLSEETLAENPINNLIQIIKENRLALHKCRNITTLKVRHQRISLICSVFLKMKIQSLNF